MAPIEFGSPTFAAPEVEVQSPQVKLGAGLQAVKYLASRRFPRASSEGRRLFQLPTPGAVPQGSPSTRHQRASRLGNGTPSQVPPVKLPVKPTTRQSGLVAPWPRKATKRSGRTAPIWSAQ